ncbi:MAG: fibronectin type III domain-containing protein [Candidatus Nanopelagicales bacterium]
MEEVQRGIAVAARRAFTLRATLFAAVLACLASLAGPAAATQPEPVRVLLIGDSVTQGSTGDWTWRFRLWRHLTASGVDVDFVGPRDDLFDSATFASGSHEYADPDFDQDHAASWGASLAVEGRAIGGLLDQYHPDVIIEMLGINDLNGWAEPPSTALSQLNTFVADARAASPSVDVVFGELPQVWLSGVNDFNQGLTVLAQSLDTAGSRVLAAPTGQGLIKHVDTYDAAHLAATGEVAVAAGFADALADLGIGTVYPRPLPQVPNGPRQPAILSVQPGDGTATLSWLAPPGATAEYVWTRNRTTGEPWNQLPIPVPGTSWTATYLHTFDEYEFRLQSAKGTAIAADLFSNEVTVTPLPPAVQGLRALVRRHRLRVSWNPVSSAPGYRIDWWPSGHRGNARTFDTSDTSLVLRDLSAGRRYHVRVSTLTYGHIGPAASTSGTPTGPVPRGPSSLRVEQTSARLLRLTWSARKRATRYEIWHKSGKHAWRSLGWVKRPRFDSPRLRPRLRQSFRVRSWHQFVPGGWSPTRKVRLSAG